MEKSKLPGLNVMLLGASGVGKTTAFKSWLPLQVTPMIIFTEPSYEVLGKDLCPSGGIHWHYIPPVSPSFKDLIDSAKKINTFDLKGLSSMADINKQKYQQFIDLLQWCNKFVCDGCGQDFGAVDTWGTDKVFGIDSLSGLNLMAMNLVVGSKPVKSMSDWGIAMDNEERFLQKICTDTRCHFVLTAHTEREVDEVTGAYNIMASTLGKKLAPKLPRFFSDVVLAQLKGSSFTWSTTAAGADLKARNLPLADNQLPDFSPLVKMWQSRGGIIEVPEDKPQQ